MALTKAEELRILDATIGVLAAARRLGISEKEVKGRLAAGELGGVKLGSEWRVSAAHIKRLLAEHNGNISAAARVAGIDRMSIHKMLHRLGIDNPGRD